jgi:hypothetical protein
MTDQQWPAEVAETEARGETKAIYRDIKAVLGVPMVNLLYRRLAVEPAALRWTWGTIRSAARAGEFARRASILSDPLSLLQQQAVQCETLRCIGVGREAQASISSVVAAYNCANPRNLIGTLMWAALLEGKSPKTVPRPQRALIASPAAGFVDVVLPPMIGIDQMDANTAAVVRRLLKWRDPSQTPSVPSLYRHLANWPGFLALALIVLEPQFSSGAIAQAQHAVRSMALSIAQDILSRRDSKPLAPPGGSALTLIREIAGTYPIKIAEVVVVGHVLASMLPRCPDA